MKLYVLCAECAERLVGEGEAIVTLAWAPAFEPDEDNILVASPVPAPNPKAGGGVIVCEGDCGRLLAVAPSSRWLFERAERALPLGL